MHGKGDFRCAKAGGALLAQRRAGVGNFPMAGRRIGGAIRGPGPLKRVERIFEDRSIAAIGRCQRAGVG